MTLPQIAGEHIGTWTDFPFSADDHNRVSAHWPLHFFAFSLSLFFFPSISFLAFAEYLLCILVIRWQHASPHSTMHRNKVRHCNGTSQGLSLSPSAFFLFSSKLDLMLFFKPSLLLVFSSISTTLPKIFSCSMLCYVRSLLNLFLSFKWQAVSDMGLLKGYGYNSFQHCKILLLLSRKKSLL